MGLRRGENSWLRLNTAFTTPRQCLCLYSLSAFLANALKAENLLRCAIMKFFNGSPLVRVASWHFSFWSQCSDGCLAWCNNNRIVPYCSGFFLNRIWFLTRRTEQWRSDYTQHDCVHFVSPDGAHVPLAVWSCFFAVGWLWILRTVLSYTWVGCIFRLVVLNWRLRHVSSIWPYN